MNHRSSDSTYWHQAWLESQRVISHFIQEINKLQTKLDKFRKEKPMSEIICDKIDCRNCPGFAICGNTINQKRVENLSSANQTMNSLKKLHQEGR